MQNFSVGSSIKQLVVGRPAENIVTVFSSGGPTSSSLRITSIARLANGHVVLQGVGVPGGAHTIERSLSLASGSFGFLAPTTADGAGLVQFTNTTSTGLNTAFYRLAFP